MKPLLQKIVNLYNTNAKFHSFVITLEYAALGFATTYSGGVPSSKAAWFALGSGFVGAIVGAVKRWLATNVATQNLQLKTGGSQ